MFGDLLQAFVTHTAVEFEGKQWLILYQLPSPRLDDVDGKPRYDNATHYLATPLPGIYPAPVSVIRVPKEKKP